MRISYSSADDLLRENCLFCVEVTVVLWELVARLLPSHLNENFLLGALDIYMLYYTQHMFFYTYIFLHCAAYSSSSFLCWSFACILVFRLLKSLQNVNGLKLHNKNSKTWPSLQLDVSCQQFYRPLFYYCALWGKYFLVFYFAIP